MRLMIVFILLSFALSASAQNYIEYQRIFNRIDDDVLSQHLEIAALRLDTVYNNYSFIYASHCVKALQICVARNDSASADKWLKKAILAGVPLWMLRQNHLTGKALFYHNTQETLQHYDSLRSVYHAAVNVKLAMKIDSLLAIDFSCTKKVNDGFILFRHTLYGLHWMHNNRKEFKILKQITETYGFPAEHIIGLPASYDDSVAYAPFVAANGLAVSLQDRRAFFMLVHYYSNPRKDINELLYANMLKGYIPPLHYAHINAFLTRFDRGKHGNYPAYEWNKNTNDTAIAEIDKRRAAIGLNTLEQKKRNEGIMLKRRKEKTLAEEIILE